MSTALPRRDPAELGVDPAAVLRFVEAVDADAAIELHSVMLLRHGAVVAEGWWAPHTPDRTRLLYSLSKSFTSAALGIAVDEGLVQLDDALLSYFPELDADVTDPRSRSITLRHLASMASGHDHDMLDDVTRKDLQNPVRGFLQLPPSYEPGTRFFYNQPCTYSLAAVLQRVTGERLSAYLRPRLLDPLGIGAVGWADYPPGQELGFTGLFARTEDVAKLGQVFLQRGRWDDRQLIPEWYVDEATSFRVDSTPGQENPDWRQGYCYQFWRSRHGYRGDGAFGQFCVVLPEYDVVLATTGGTEAMQAVLEHVWTLLLPAFVDDVPGGDATEALRDRLASLSLPACAASTTPQSVFGGGSFPVQELPWEQATTLTAVGVPGDGSTVVLVEGESRLEVALGSGEWLVSDAVLGDGSHVPVAASGGWLDDETLRAEVVFLETAHRMDITVSRSDATARAQWRTQRPLDGGALATLHRPSTTP